MTDTVTTALNLATALNVLSSKELEASTSFKVARNLQILRPTVEAFEGNRREIVNKQIGAENVKPDGSFDAKPDDFKAMDAALASVLATPVDLSDLYKISIKSLEGVKVTPEVMGKLSSIIVD